MVKPVKKVTRGSITRERKKLIVVGTEGENKTEEMYLRNLEKMQNRYHFIFTPGNYTDPIQIVNATIKGARKEKLRFKSGDMAVSIFDLDVNKSKEVQLCVAREIGRKNHVDIISSNPCFEIWFLEHFVYTSKQFNSNRELIRELNKFLPHYSKSNIQFGSIFPLTNKAVKNCEKLEEYHRRNSNIEPFDFNNPRTDMHKLVKTVMGQ